MDHVPVLLQEVLEAFRDLPNPIIVDATLGGGGHTMALLEANPRTVVLAIDADAHAIKAVDDRLHGEMRKRVYLVHGNFRHLGKYVEDRGLAPVAGVLFDFGFSSIAMADPACGMSLHEDGPLDMRFDQSKDTLTAADVVNTWDEVALRDCLARFGEERAARRIAETIVARRVRQSFAGTVDLANVVAGVVPRRGKIHPATRTFQALRIAVNDELGAIESALPEALAHMAPEGRIITIAFHSLEDRIVKTWARREKERGTVVIHTKHVQRPSREEVLGNPRSRSARMRVIEKK